ncbi:putative exopolyphosphatase [Gracilariopsis chorda]|uniref:Putative exopolyphosphatase n=1 Tax=Gracilariopsis chorda TaxID=448386 RepID=A0A2V3J4Z1_9FLOR|nr:putative exopolyphosphatase [Gracilariopsis chorda]|eukprot:PXF49192.1 putative exopolyphosphatase [Gracilariopsis chorda]
MKTMSGRSGGEEGALSTYLRSVRTVKPGRVVVGNEACDLDSIACSLAYGFLSHKASEQTVAPILQVRRDELELRGDAVAAIAKCGVDESALRFLGEEGDELRGCEIVLVDHNEVTARVAMMDGRVVGVIDHHRDEGGLLEACPRVVEGVGSCSTLVVETAVERGWTVPKDVALLLLSASVMDVGGGADNERATERDGEAATNLRAWAGVDEEWTKKWHGELKQKRNEVEGLSTRQLLRKDLKEIGSQDGTVISLCSIPTDPRRVDEGGLLAFLEERGAAMVVVLARFEGRRETLLLGSGELCDAVERRVAAEGDDVGWTMVHERPVQALVLRHLRQRNFGASRKRVLPLVRDALHALSTQL